MLPNFPVDDDAEGRPVDSVAEVATQLSRLGDLFELYLYRQGGPSIAEMRASQQMQESGVDLGRTFVQTMTDEELADREWRDMHGRTDEEVDPPPLGAPR